MIDRSHLWLVVFDRFHAPTIRAPGGMHLADSVVSEHKRYNEALEDLHRLERGQA